MLQLWEPAGAEAFAELARFQQLFQATWRAVKSFEGQQCSREDATVTMTASWMRTLHAVLRLLRTMARAEGTSASLPYSLSMASQHSAAWGLRMAGAIVQLLCRLGCRAVDGGLQPNDQPDAMLLSDLATDCWTALLALLEVESFWDQLTQLLGPTSKAVLAQAGWLSSRQRCKCVAFYIWSGLCDGQYSQCEGVADLSSRLFPTKHVRYHQDMGPLKLLFSWLFR